jgi:hypothetical protein
MFSASNVAELISAINSANQNAVPDTIVLSPGTTFTLTEVNNTTHGSTGLPKIADSTELTIVGNGGVIERSTTEGTPFFRLFDVAPGASLALEHLTLQGGRTAFDWAAYGGAIYNDGNLALDGVTVQNSIARGRMGANCTRCRPGGIGGPGWPASGGGIYSGGALLLENSMVLGNYAQGGPGGFGTQGGHRGRGGDGRGGGLYVAAGTAILRSSFVAGNNAQGGVGSPLGGGYGGGLSIAGADVTLDEFTFAHVTSNTASTNYPNIFGPYEIISDPNPLPGDYNQNGTVDSADYTVWRDHLGNSTLANRGPGITGPIGQADYDYWKSNFGNTSQFGSGATALASASPAVPEPATFKLVGLAIAVLAVANKRLVVRGSRCPRVSRPRTNLGPKVSSCLSDWRPAVAAAARS